MSRQSNLSRNEWSAVVDDTERALKGAKDYRGGGRHARMYLDPKGKMTARIRDRRTGRMRPLTNDEWNIP